jgi:catalase
MSHLVPESIKTAIMGTESAKIAQMEANTQDVAQNDRITSDWGTRQSNTDDWLRVNRDDQIGPMLLEDGFGREKVSEPNQLSEIETLADNLIDSQI